jgi:N-methylhydantoinase A
MATRVGVDVGGTFTDLICYDDESGQVFVAKEPTTPSAPQRGVVDAVRAGVPEHVVGASRYFLHGTTISLNALIERKGARVGLLCSEGFRDVLEIRRGYRPNEMDAFSSWPEPLVPRHLRVSVTERVRADGEIHKQLDPEGVRAAVELFRAEGVECIAIAFMNAYVNPVHEIEAERLLQELGFDGDISVSHRVSGEHREYERTSTTVIDAYIRPRLRSYLADLTQALTDAGLRGDMLLTRSGGGAMTFDEARERPFEAIMSGPVAGSEGAAELSRNLGLGDLVTADVGGTSFDTALIRDGHPIVLFEGKVDGMPLQTPWVDVRSVGAGGGSIAHIDAGGLLEVGPQSAGASPGPACYGRGGTLPTVTDAACWLGMLGEGRLAGSTTLDRDAAGRALALVAEPLGLTLDEAAKGIVTIASANMANAIREITIEQGEDPRTMKLVPFGGAGPLFGTLLAQELQMKEIVVPPHAGGFSAWGLLGADLVRDIAKTRIVPLSEPGLAAAADILTDLWAQLEARGASVDGAEREVRLSMRYIGQEHTVTILVPTANGALATDATSVETIRALFDAAYERAFLSAMTEPVEIQTVRAAVRTALPRREEQGHAAAEGVAQPTSTVEGYSFTRDERMPFDIVERSSLTTGATVSGPAILVEETTTTYLDAGYVAEVHPSGCLFIR